MGNGSNTAEHAATAAILQHIRLSLAATSTLAIAAAHLSTPSGALLACSALVEWQTGSLG